MVQSASTGAQAQVPDPISDLARLKNYRARQVSSWDKLGGNMDAVSGIQPGAEVVFADIKGPGIITNIWVTIGSEEQYFLRKIVLKIYWDDEPGASVNVPIGDFFGIGFGEYVHYFSFMTGMTSGGYISYFPMPFKTRAKLEIVNEGEQPVSAFYFHVGFQAWDALPDDMAYFHARFRRDDPVPSGADYLILDAVGRGHFVGLNLNMQGKAYNSLGFLEGDEHIVVDGEKRPSFMGTGTEDYFQSGWYFNQGPFSSPWFGAPLIDRENSRVSAYRFHVPDPVPFTKSLKVSIEVGALNNFPADYSSTAYWYQVEPHAPFDIPPVDKRMPSSPPEKP